MNLASRLHIGMPMIGGEFWLGGITYVESLVTALHTLPENERPQLSLIVEPHQLGELKSHHYFVHLFDQIIFLGKVASVPPDIVGVKTKLVTTYTKLFKNIDFYFPANSKTLSKGCYAAWIPDLQHLVLPNFFTEQNRNNRNKLFSNIANNAKLIVFSSQAAHNDFIKYFPNSPATVRVLNFHIMPKNEWYEGNVSEVKNKYNIEGSYFICCNQFWIHKNHSIIFEALKRLKRLKQTDTNIRVVFTGSTQDYRDSGYFAKLMSFVKENDLDENVNILGSIDRFDQIQLMRGALAVIQPSFFEGWSTVVEDARTLGKKILLSDLEVNKEQLGEQGFYFDPHSVEDLMATINESLPALSDGPNLTQEQQARQAAINNMHVYANQICSIAVEAQYIYHRKIPGVSDKFWQLTNSTIQYKNRMDEASAEALNQQGEQAMLAGDMDKAMLLFNQALSINPGLAKTYNNLGVVYWQKLEHEKALEFVEKALQLDPENFTARDNWQQMSMQMSR